MSHAVFVAQSLDDAQPHAPETQACPSAELEQSAQIPTVPQALPLAPPRQVPPVIAEQQPLLHGAVEPQVVEHVCVKGSQALPAGQSLAVAQPQ